MATLTKFNQGDLLVGVSDPWVKGGICVALCDHWLALMKDTNSRTPPERMAQLQQYAGRAMTYQKAYGQQRRTKGREEARADMGKQLGHDFADQTTIMRVMVGFDGILARMTKDLGAIGSAVTWTMALPGVGRHAIAGYRGLESLTTNMHRASLHIYDPNVGEYVGTLQELNGILRDLFKRIPEYALINELSRTTDES